MYRVSVLTFEAQNLEEKVRNCGDIINLLVGGWGGGMKAEARGALVGGGMKKHIWVSGQLATSSITINGAVQTSPQLMH